MPYLEEWQARDIVTFVLDKYLDGVVSIDGKVVMDFSDPSDIINRRLVAKLGDALLKVEPGDVTIQIRKKE